MARAAVENPPPSPALDPNRLVFSSRFYATCVADPDPGFRMNPDLDIDQGFCETKNLKLEKYKFVIKKFVNTIFL